LYNRSSDRSAGEILNDLNVLKCFIVVFVVATSSQADFAVFDDVPGSEFLGVIYVDADRWSVNVRQCGGHRLAMT
jgi:hypothetical protein